MRLKLTLEYDGTHFRGWAVQPGLRTIEGVVRDALDVFPSSAGLAVAGRTDTGVHALGNVVSVDVEGGPPAKRVAEALNAALPDDAVAAEEMGPDFNTRHRRACAVTGIALAPARVVTVRAPAFLVYCGCSTERLAVAADLLVGARPGLTTETQHQSFRRNVSAAAWLSAATRLSSRSLRTASSDTWSDPRRDDAPAALNASRLARRALARRG